MTGPLLWQALLDYCAAEDKKFPVHLVAFAEWLAIHRPVEAEIFERLAAKVYNAAFEKLNEGNRDDGNGQA